MLKESNSTRTALLAGATGLAGSYVLNLLLNDPSYSKVIVPVRQPTGIKNAKLEEHIVNFDNIEAYKDLIIADEVFCCLGTTIKKAGSQEAFKKVDYKYPLDLAKIALTNGASRFLIISSIGADTNSRAFYLRVKGEMENEISKLNYKSISIFRPSLIIGDRKEKRPGENIWKIFMKGLSPLLMGNLKKYRAIEASAIAKAMVITAKEFHQGISIYESDIIQSIAG
jgi:uncharacterized protein YbjT (DUF2867 family)